uniref:Uncharacterized protein n=1 Tax=Arundo donax TaxID=35708 RepID=A0A0A9EZL5_ARUDO
MPTFLMGGRATHALLLPVGCGSNEKLRMQSRLLCKAESRSPYQNLSHLSSVLKVTISLDCRW